MLNQALPEMIAELLRENEELKRQRDEARRKAEEWREEAWIDPTGCSCWGTEECNHMFPWEKQGRKI